MNTFRRPSPDRIERALRGLEPWRLITAPKFFGLENLPAERPLLFVGNHSLYGLLDAPLMVAELYAREGIFLRSLGDHMHFKIPVWRDLVADYGMVDGTRENCARLMDAGEAILVFPGGRREVAKRKGERYKLIWKERLGFARMAVHHGCTIVPFAALGAEDAYDIVADVDDMLASPLGVVLRGLNVDPDGVPPIVRGVGPTPLPRAERLYYHFGAAIPTREHAGRADDDAVCRALRDRVRASVEAGLADLQRHRARDPVRALLPRVVGAVRRVLAARAR